VATEGTRTGRPKGQGLASSLCLLVLAGVSCKVQVSLPSADSGPGDSGSGGARDTGVSFDAPPVSVEKTGSFSEQCRSNTHGAYVSPYDVQMVIALDRSSSMQQKLFDGTMSRLQAAQAALKQALSEHTGIDYFLEPFPCAGPYCYCGRGSTCCTVEPSLLTSIENQMGCGFADGGWGCSPSGNDSPSHQALRLSREYLLNPRWSPPHAFRFILLITDKDPTCSGDASIDACGQAKDEAARNLISSVQTFVLSLNSDSSGTPCLQDIANASATAGAPSQFSTATYQQELKQQIGEILTKVEKNRCWFYVDGPPNGQSSTVNQPVQVMVDGNYLPSERGYNYNPINKTLVLDEAPCEAWLKSGDPAPTVTLCQPPQ
jgi:hypothetical protein